MSVQPTPRRKLGVLMALVLLGWVLLFLLVDGLIHLASHLIH